MSSEPTPTRRPIAAVRVSTVALLGIVAAVAVPAGAASLVMSGSVEDHHRLQSLSQAGPVTRVVVEDTGGSVRITGDKALSGVTGQAALHWPSWRGVKDVQVAQRYADGVLTLSKDCGGCEADLVLQVPPDVSVQVRTTDAGIYVADVSGGVDLHTDNGGIEADRLGSGVASMHTSNAGIRATFVGAPKSISATTSNDGVSITTDGRTPYYDDVQTTNGDPILRNPQNRKSDDVIFVRTTNHSVTIR